MTSKPTATDSPVDATGSPAIGSPTSLETLLKLPATWKTADGKTSTGTYGVTLRKIKGADVAFLTRAGVRAGTLTLGGKTYPVALADNTADGVYDNARAAKAKKPRSGRRNRKASARACRPVPLRRHS